jgi:hypothetical protein
MNHLADLILMSSTTEFKLPLRWNYMLSWSVTPSTIKRYHQHVREFVHYCTINQEEDPTTEQLFDELLLDYIHHLYESGLGKSKASMTLYGIINILPNLKDHLHKSSQAVKVGINVHLVFHTHH